MIIIIIISRISKYVICSYVYYNCWRPSILECDMWVCSVLFYSVLKTQLKRALKNNKKAIRIISITVTRVKGKNERQKRVRLYLVLKSFWYLTMGILFLLFIPLLIWEVKWIWVFQKHTLDTYHYIIWLNKFKVKI